MPTTGTAFSALAAPMPLLAGIIDPAKLAIIALPMILITFFFSLTGRFPAHKKIARWTFPIWLYVSVSGVFVYFLQAVIHR